MTNRLTTEERAVYRDLAASLQRDLSHTDDQPARVAAAGLVRALDSLDEMEAERAEERQRAEILWEKAVARGMKLSAAEARIKELARRVEEYEERLRSVNVAYLGLRSDLHDALVPRHRLSDQEIAQTVKALARQVADLELERLEYQAAALREQAILARRVEAIEAAWAGALGNLISLADVAMKEANNDGGEYDRDEELREARAALAASGDGAKEPRHAGVMEAWEVQERCERPPMPVEGAALGERQRIIEWLREEYAEPDRDGEDFCAYVRSIAADIEAGTHVARFAPPMPVEGGKRERLRAKLADYFDRELPDDCDCFPCDLADGVLDILARFAPPEQGEGGDD